MSRLALSVDVVLRIAISRQTAEIEELLEKARSGEDEILIFDSVLYYTFASIKETDHVNWFYLTELLRLSIIWPTSEPGDAEREEWIPEAAEIEHWREVALQDEDY